MLKSKNRQWDSYIRIGSKFTLVETAWNKICLHSNLQELIELCTGKGNIAENGIIGNVKNQYNSA